MRTSAGHFICYFCLVKMRKSSLTLRQRDKLLQEIYQKDPWRVLISCMMLNQTTRTQVDQVRFEFFKRWPTPEKAARADQHQMSEVIKTLGLMNRRSASIIKMSQQYSSGEWVRAIDLFGIGQYGHDSFDIFINGNLKIKPQDKELKKYMARMAK